MTAPTATMHPVAVAFNAILDEMSQVWFERRAVIEADIITTLAKQHSFKLGPPGTGKSEMTRDLVSRFIGAEYFESLLSKTRPDAAILGPYNLPELRDKGDFHRKIAGFLPTANFAFLDEIGKMSPTLGHDLLAILNERLLHEVNGQRSAKPVPLYSCYTASNELIAEESDDAAALWDRILVRVYVDYIVESGNFAMLLMGSAPNNATTQRTEVQFTDLADVIDNVVPAVNVPLDVVEAMGKLRVQMRSAEIRVSDRRWKACMRLLRASAFLAGRNDVNEDDMRVLRYALWDVPPQIEAVERMVLTLSNPTAEKCLALMDDLKKISEEIRNHAGESLESRSKVGARANASLKVVVSELSQLRQECIAADRSTVKIEEVADQVDAVQRSIYVDCMDFDPTTVPSARANAQR